MPCGCASDGSGRWPTMLSMVWRTSLISLRLAPATAKPIGTPCPSVNRLRLTPALPRSVGLGPVFFPAQRGFGHGPVHTQPIPVDPLQVIELCDACLPQVQKDIRLHPFLKTIMSRRMCHQFGLIECLPLAARTQYIE